MCFKYLYSKHIAFKFLNCCCLHFLYRTVHIYHFLFVRLPPPQPPQNEAQQNQEPTKTNPCSRFFANCKRKVPCACCKKQTKSEEAQRTAQVKSDEEEKKVGCFGCRKGRKELPEDRVSLAQTQESQKKGCLDRLKCCGKNKVSDKTTTGCCPRKSFKDKWARSDSILSESPPSRFVQLFYVM